MTKFVRSHLWFPPILGESFPLLFSSAVRLEELKSVRLCSAVRAEGDTAVSCSSKGESENMAPISSSATRVWMVGEGAPLSGLVKLQTSTAPAVINYI